MIRCQCYAAPFHIQLLIETPAPSLLTSRILFDVGICGLLHADRHGLRHYLLPPGALLVAIPSRQHLRLARTRLACR